MINLGKSEMTKITGHRGARNLWAENSLDGFRNTLDLGVDGVEFDIHLTDAGEMLVIHDPLLDRTTNATGEVRALTPKARKSVTLKESDETIPTLDDVLTLFANAPDVIINAEIKVGPDDVPYASLEHQVVEAIRKHDLQNRTKLTGFSPEVLERCRTIAPDMSCLMSLNKNSSDKLGGLEKTLDRGLELADVIAVQIDLLDEQWDYITSRVPLEKICAWVPNSEEDLKHWLDRGVGYITTDRPDLGLKLRKEMSDASR